MKLHRFPGLVFVFVLFAYSNVLSAAPKTAAPATNAPAADAHQWEIPQSVFQIPANPKEGRDPFFPNAILGPQPVKPKETAPLDLSGFVLNGITSPPKRTAMINGRTFETGESGEVKLPNGGKALIKCVEIKSDSAIIEVAGQRQELKMRFGV
jgi:hypothetical protein